MLRFSTVIAVLTSLTCSSANSVSGAAQERDANAPDAAVRIQFNRDVRPILASNCFDCHGFDAKKRQAELRLDTAEGALQDHNGSAAIRPGDLSGSEVWNRIVSDDPDVVMPPPSTKKSLTSEQKQTLKLWIEQGAVYQQHWAFEPPVTATEAAPAEPAPAASSWARTQVDHYILKELQQRGLQPQPEADRETLIRRVAFTLTGLPPTIAEVDLYLADTSAKAYENMVDRYLASPRYGEEQARHWLDVARYGDTHGLHLDNERQMWAYRDWVVKAFNSNLPFDQFTTWQLAGDLLPEPTLDQLVATGFNRCNVTTSEGGAISEEWLYRYAVDRTSTVMQAWMGLTAGCAVCHDHKFDPVTQRDFYSMYSFFYSATDPAMDGNIRDTKPFVKVPSPEQQQALLAAREHEAAVRQKLEAALASVPYTDPASGAAASQSGQPVSDAIIDDDFQLGAKVRNTSRNDVQWVLDPEFSAKSGRRVLELAFGSRYDVTVDPTLIPVVVPEQEGQLEFWLRIDPFYPPTVFAVQLDDGSGAKRVYWGDGSEFGNSGNVNMGEVPGAGEWIHYAIDLTKAGIRPGSQIKSLALIQNRGRIWVDDVRISGRNTAAADPLSSFQAWWIRSKGTKPDAVPAELMTLLTGGPKDDAPADQVEKLKQFYLSTVQRISESPIHAIRAELQDAKLKTVAIDATIPGTFVFGDLEKPRDAFVMMRGQYDKPGDKVVPAVPDAFPPLRSADGQPLSKDQRANRLDLARWLLSAENPLTARVTVNRFWQQIFGTGIVKTSDDFGTRGDYPSHPELLDWLALHYRSIGWDTKQLYKLLLTSAVFRQQAVTSDAIYQQDPENRLLARGARFRLDAEQLRDNALYVSGLMDLTMGGRGVLPYQPPDIWEPVGYENSNTRFYMQDHGSSLYRRSVYCFLKRTAPPPFMSNFDGPNREQFCTRRERSNTPLQALQLMNDVQHFEAARALAERAVSEGGLTPEERILWMYRSVLSRRPDATELMLTKKAFQVQHDLFAAEPAAAAKAIRVGDSTPKSTAGDVETAAWTMIANLILNLDEAVCRN